MIYLDHNATTPPDERVLEAMMPFLGRFYGNPSSLYRLGRVSRTAIEQAREQVAALVGARPDEVVFTSGGTEANNLAIKGLAGVLPRGAIAIGATEHPAVAVPAVRLRSAGWDVSIVPVDGEGRLDAAFVASQGSADLRFVSLMLANNETGMVQEMAPLANGLRERGVVVHCDAVQAAGKMPVDFPSCGAHLLSLSAHKIYGPKGAGALIVDNSVRLAPLLDGGGQEGDLRGGTENVAAIVGFGRAAELARVEMDARRRHMLTLRHRLEAGLSHFSGVTLFSARAERLPNTLQFGIAGIDGEALVMALDRRNVA
ncbi:MAG: cysteine desulfurase, partial [Proteobacteria bacterium]|nr:cysteine desulfurase [Pseudomonadota bacterium]